MWIWGGLLLRYVLLTLKAQGAHSTGPSPLTFCHRLNWIFPENLVKKYLQLLVVQLLGCKEAVYDLPTPQNPSGHGQKSPTQTGSGFWAWYPRLFKLETAKPADKVGPLNKANQFSHFPIDAPSTASAVLPVLKSGKLSRRERKLGCWLVDYNVWLSPSHG